MHLPKRQSSISSDEDILLQIPPKILIRSLDDVCPWSSWISPEPPTSQIDNQSPSSLQLAADVEDVCEGDPDSQIKPLSDLDASEQPTEEDLSWSASIIPDTLASHITASTFGKHLRALVAEVQSPSEIDPLGARVNYLYKLATQLEDMGLVSCGISKRLCNISQSAPAARPPDPKPLMRFFEAATQNQIECNLWALLRNGLTTASTLKWDARGPCFSPQWLQQNTDFRREAPGQASAVIFGRLNEPTVRTLLFKYSIGRADEPTGNENEQKFIFHQPTDISDEQVHTCGVLMDAYTGMVGASLDILVCPRDQHGLLAPPPNFPLSFYEVKCRAKYAFDPMDITKPIVAAYNNLLSARTPAAFQAFIQSINKPGVQYMAPETIPGPEEALLTAATQWKPCDGRVTKRRPTALDKQLLELNKTAMSDILLFGPPDVHAQTIQPLSWSSGNFVYKSPIFANPRHSNFKQILVQAYVLSSHFAQRPIYPHLVTFIGRYRTPEEEGLNFQLESRSLSGTPEDNQDGTYNSAKATITPEQAIPVALLITPIHIDQNIYTALRHNSQTAFADTVAHIWASSHQSAETPATKTP
ncbi:alkaline exonuclease [Macropodid alphaherpesvirus 2]|uniref:Alkaline exonuclease n=1 Tax=Macropodid alphaherpesvirus 2 TaxID=83440 RepID=A0AAE7MLK5_9ALPH|nr:alkaline exonuclease [Macropodid alphaherpesvirus 2]QOD40207.1 alkaline exonuclease [Macropodid alphaherpesvirus 2]WGO49751.1 alkaline exonuclease [Macropodid alphaherpesvirus 2]